MSTHKSINVDAAMRRLTVPDIRAHKRRDGAEPLVCLTAYTVLTARLLDAHTDLLLVGDSLGMVLYGLDSTVGVTMDMMVLHGQAVMRGAKRSCVIVDMPFGSYQESPEVAFRNAARIMKDVGCAGVKIEGGAEMAPTVKFLSERGIPVLGHVGLMPQSVNTMGGFKAQGREDDAAQKIIDDAKALEEAGAFAVVVEGTMEHIARRITDEIAVPTIGIGGSPACDGQILVTEDMAGLFTEFKPKFVKRYMDLGGGLAEAARQYADEVRTGTFPADEHCFGVKKKS
ncbi:3-methyl-2-oxobutanoate hydroxymethyltransferase [Magnetovibrio sp. PR-2]|uniref:3-methyl-2-oxobutanoate hydroxymethyltransferase n=1 Tax=Magnetovibrio sp. PR-2 TaxID=3120356 RepID=UPI002FCE0BCA